METATAPTSGILGRKRLSAITRNARRRVRYCSTGRRPRAIVKAFTPGKLNLAPETLEEEVLQNVAIIVSTPKFSVPLDRGLGLAQRFIDKPIQVAQSILISEVLDAVEEYEPRAEVTNVTFEAGETPGLLVPVLEVNIVDNEE